MVHLNDVKASRHHNVHWGQQIRLCGFIHLIRCQQHAIGRLLGVWVMKKGKQGGKKLFITTETICFDQKWSALLLRLGDI